MQPRHYNPVSWAGFSCGLKWKESSETGASCRSFRLRGQDICLSYDAHGRLTRRAVYQNTGWIRTDYFSVKDGVHPLVSLVADDTQDKLLRYDRVPDREPPVYTRQVLLPLKLEVDTALQSYVNTEIGEPSVVLARTDGDYVYCTADEKSRREQLAAQGLPPALLEELVLTQSEPQQSTPPEFSLSDEMPEEAAEEEASEEISELPAQEETPVVPDLSACEPEVEQEPDLPQEPEVDELPIPEEIPEEPAAEKNRNSGRICTRRGTAAAGTADALGWRRGSRNRGLVLIPAGTARGRSGVLARRYPLSVYGRHGKRPA